MLTEIKVCAEGLEKGKERGGYGCQENRIGFKNKKNFKSRISLWEKAVHVKIMCDINC